jgi:hypothetical protein
MLPIQGGMLAVFIFYWSQSLVKTMRFERKTLVATHLLNLQNE